MTFLNKKYALGLPKGSVRSILALIIVSSAIYGLITNKLTSEQFLMIISVITGFYFASKNKNGD